MDPIDLYGFNGHDDDTALGYLDAPLGQNQETYNEADFGTADAYGTEDGNIHGSPQDGSAGLYGLWNNLGPEPAGDALLVPDDQLGEYTLVRPNVPLDMQTITVTEDAAGLLSAPNNAAFGDLPVDQNDILEGGGGISLGEPLEDREEFQHHHNSDGEGSNVLTTEHDNGAHDQDHDHDH